MGSIQRKSGREKMQNRPLAFAENENLGGNIEKQVSGCKKQEKLNYK